MMFLHAPGELGGDVNLGGLNAAVAADEAFTRAGRPGPDGDGWFQSRFFFCLHPAGAVATTAGAMGGVAGAATGTTAPSLYLFSCFAIQLQAHFSQPQGVC
jgi:hypothetical protein